MGEVGKFREASSALARRTVAVVVLLVVAWLVLKLVIGLVATVAWLVVAAAAVVGVVWALRQF